MSTACLRLRAKGIRCSCRTAFAVGRDILARVVPSRASNMSPTSSILHGKSMLGENCSLWLELSAAGVRAWLGFLQRARHPVHQNAGAWYLGMFDRTHSNVCRGSCKGPFNRHHIDSSGVSFVTVSRVFQESCSPPRGEPRVSGLQRWQLYLGRSFHVDKVGR